MSSDITVPDIPEKRGSDKLTGVFDGVVVKKDQQTHVFCCKSTTEYEGHA